MTDSTLDPCWHLQPVVGLGRCGNAASGPKRLGRFAGVDRNGLASRIGRQAIGCRTTSFGVRRVRWSASMITQVGSCMVSYECGQHSVGLDEQSRPACGDHGGTHDVQMGSDVVSRVGVDISTESHESDSHHAGGLSVDMGNATVIVDPRVPVVTVPPGAPPLEAPEDRLTSRQGPQTPPDSETPSQPSAIRKPARLVRRPLPSQTRRRA